MLEYQIEISFNGIGVGHWWIPLWNEGYNKAWVNFKHKKKYNILETFLFVIFFDFINNN
jgi:hypothetical protein